MFQLRSGMMLRATAPCSISSAISSSIASSPAKVPSSQVAVGSAPHAWMKL